MWLNRQCINELVPAGQYGGSMCICPVCSAKRNQTEKPPRDYTPPVELADGQWEHGAELVSEFADKYDLSDMKAIEILSAVHEIKEFYNWVNASSYLLNMRDYFEFKENNK